MPPTPLIGVTPSIDPSPNSPDSLRVRVNEAYLRTVAAAGGTPIVLHPDPALIPRYLDRLDGVLLTGGDDIDPRPWGGSLHAKAELMHPMRQAFDFGLLEALTAVRPGLPMLGICLGMQEMAVARGCPLIQHLPDVLPTADQHAADRIHEIEGSIGRGLVTSYHHQAIADPGPFEVIARSPDGLIEGLRDPSRPFCLGVQWHPERTVDPALGAGVIAMLVAAASR
jgi:putative glutamine amidotransferase